MQVSSSEERDPERATSEMVLGRCLVEGDPVATASSRRRRRKTFGVSLAIEMLLLGLLVAIPLLTTVAQPPLRRDAPIDITFIHGSRSHHPTQPKRPTATGHTQNPIVTMRPGIRCLTRPLHHEADRGDDQAPYVPEGGDVPGAVEIAEAGRSPFVPPPHIEPPPRPEKHPVKLSEGVLAAQLISRIEPLYPIIAIQTKTEGTVRLHAIVDKDGRITSLDVLSGHPLLVKAALDAVRQWLYRPTMLNGQPVEVETSITVIFRLRPQ